MQMVSGVSCFLFDMRLGSIPGVIPRPEMGAGVEVLCGAGVIVRGGFRGGVLVATGVVGVAVGVFEG